MTELQLQLVKGAGFAAAAAFALLLQRRWPHARQAGSWRINGAVWALDVALLGALCGACACTAAAWAAEHQVGVLRALALPGWLAIAVTIVALDGVSYAWHRANHRLHFLWRFHRVHHSDPAFTVSTAVRFHPGELLLAVPLRLAAIVLLGAPVVGVVLFEAVFACANFVEHGDIALPAAVEQRLRR
ncbi:MAG: sterol desaturase family protein, partial [Candidatus Binatia bacterium]